jgi:SAM-dependent methyltransferase
MSIYTKLYDGQGKGDTWTLPTDSSLNPRLQVVEEAASRFDGSINVLDIGCGKGGNTLGTLSCGGSWTGVDMESKEKIGLSLPTANAKFFQGDFLSEDFRKDLGTFDLIVDQGALIIGMDSAEEFKKYVEVIFSMLKPGGRFVGLFLNQFDCENGSTVYLLDGRKRGLLFPSQVVELCESYFEVESGLQYEHAYSYLPGENNPLGAKVGDSHQITTFQLIMRKK